MSPSCHIEETNCMDRRAVYLLIGYADNAMPRVPLELKETIESSFVPLIRDCTGRRCFEHVGRFFKKMHKATRFVDLIKSSDSDC